MDAVLLVLGGSMETSLPKHEVPTQWVAIYDAETSEIVHLHQRIGIDEHDTVSNDFLREEALGLTPQQEGRRLEVAFPAPDVEIDASIECEIVGGHLCPCKPRYSSYSQRRQESK